MIELNELELRGIEKMLMAVYGPNAFNWPNNVAVRFWIVEAKKIWGYESQAGLEILKKPSTSV